MNDKRNKIDELFSEGLGDFNPAPPPELWGKIGADLPAPASVPPASGSGRIIAIGIAAVVITGLALLWFMTGNKSSGPGKNETIQQTKIPAADNADKSVYNQPESGKSGSSPISVKQDSENDRTTYKHDKKSENQTLNTVKSTSGIVKSELQNKEFLAKSSNRQFQNPEPIEEKTQQISTLSDLRRDFTCWLNALPVTFSDLSATTAFNYKLKKSKKPAIPKGTNIPLIGGLYAGYDLIDYGNGNKKQSHSLGLSLSTFKGPFILETGVALNLSEDNGRFMVNYNSFDSIGYYNKVVSFSVNPQNPGTVQFNTEVQGVFDSIDHAQEAKTTNRYTYLQIPLIAGYQLYSNRLVSITLKAGPVFSLMLGSDVPTATFIQNGANLKSIDNLSPSRVSTNWQVAAGLGVGLHLSRRFTFLAEPTYKTYLRPVYQGYRTKPQSIGIKAGLLYRF